MPEPTLWTPLCDMLGIRFPVLQAGMVPGGSPELAAAVSNAGGLGVLGASGWEPEDIRQKIRWIRDHTNNPFGVDLQLPVSMADVDDNREEVKATLHFDYPDHVAWVKDAVQRHSVPETKAGKSFAYNPAFIRRQVEVILEEEVPVFVSALGPPGWMTEDAHKLGMKVIGMAGSPRHARRHVDAGVDIVVAQGNEAGGTHWKNRHHGTRAPGCRRRIAPVRWSLPEESGMGGGLPPLFLSGPRASGAEPYSSPPTKQPSPTFTSAA